MEGLAWQSVTAVRDAAQRLADARGLGVSVGASPALVAASFAATDHVRVDGDEAFAWAPMSGFFRTAHGWVRTHANYPHHEAALTRALGASSRDELVDVVASMAALDVEEAVAAERGIAVAVRTAEQWQRHPHALATAGDPWSEVTTDGGATRPLPSTPTAVLGGVRVLDLTRVIAGPTCSQLLACLGADVLRIDPPDRPELLGQFLSNGMGKRSAAVDLGSLGSTLDELVASADVVLLGYRPGSLDRFGLEPDAVLERHPHLVVGSLSAWGEHGPWAHRPGFDSIVQAASGIATRCGSDGRPGALPVQALDHATGHRLAADVLGLLADRRAGIVRTSLLGASRELQAMDAPPELPVAELPVETLRMTTPHGEVVTVPPSLTLDGRPLCRPLGRYGAAVPAPWSERRP